MKRKFFFAGLLFAAVLVPSLALAEANLNENLAYLAIDRVDASMEEAIGLFQAYPPFLTGEEIVAFRGKDAPAAKWLKAGIVLYQRAWDDLVQGRFRESVAKANHAHDIFTMLIRLQKSYAK
jgi:hypothetical protein